MVQSGTQFEIENPELLLGDTAAIASFCLYKQVTGIVSHPHFQGWLTPLHFDPLRFLQLFLFAATLSGTWAAACLLTDGYRTGSTKDLSVTLMHVARAWLIAMPVAALLLTFAESRSVMGADGPVSILPLAASGPGEPFVSAAQMLGVVTLWRAYYAIVLDYWNSKKQQSAVSVEESVTMVGVMAVTSSVVITGVQLVVSADMLQQLLHSTWHGA